jgi:hypothetical protein
MAKAAVATVETPQQAIAATVEPKPVALQEVTRELFLARLRKPAVIKPVECPELGLKLYVRSLLLSEREAFLKETRDEQPDGSFTVKVQDSDQRFAVLVLCDKDGNKLLTPEDVKALSDFSWDILIRIVQAGGRINGFGVGASEEAKNESAGQPVPAEGSSIA